MSGFAPWRAVRARPRLVAGVLAGSIALLALWRSGPVLRAVLAWDVGVTVFLVLSFALFLTEKPEQMARAAEAQEEGEWTIFGLTIAAVAMSFVAVVMEFSGLKDMAPTLRDLHVGLVAYTLFASWLMAHTTFGFRYAHEYYAVSGTDGALDRGLEFPGEDEPDYLDFTYFALVLGMTFQVSDVQITSRKLRRLATLHGLLGFLFNTIIIALMVNLAAGMF